jgi:5-formyltetrahydrofolate cyclo-ligase
MNSGRKDMKSALRGLVRERLNPMSELARATASAQARALLATQMRWQSARTVLFYAPMPTELDVWPLVKEALACGKIAALPRFNSALETYVACRIQDPVEDIDTGHYGIREPNARCARNELDHFDLMLVPGLAFDMQCRRLGRGKGFYDQLLTMLHGPTCGVCFDEQVVEEVPVEAHDVRLDCLLTPTRWVEL